MKSIWSVPRQSVRATHGVAPTCDGKPFHDSKAIVSASHRPTERLASPHGTPRIAPRNASHRPTERLASPHGTPRIAPRNASHRPTERLASPPERLVSPHGTPRIAPRNASHRPEGTPRIARKERLASPCVGILMRNELPAVSEDLGLLLSVLAGNRLVGWCRCVRIEPAGVRI